MYDTDDQGLIINGPFTFRNVALDLSLGPVVLNWTDGRGTLYNVLLTWAPPRVGAHGGVISGGDRLWVAVAGRGAYAFTGEVAPGYVAEKLGLSSLVTAEQLAGLLSGVLAEIGAQRGAEALFWGPRS